MTERQSIYLSRLPLNPRSPEVQHALANCHAFHQTIMRGFPTVDSTTPRKSLEVLYRPEIDLHTHDLQVLVQSTIKPNWHALAVGIQPVLTTQASDDVVKRLDDYYGAIAAGARLRFRLRANPTKRLLALNPDGTARIRPDGRREMGKRVHLLKEEEQLGWLARRAEASGFRVESAQVHPDRLGSKRQIGWRGARDRDHDIRLDAVVFDGELTVLDPGIFRQVLVEGIGSGKSYGCGLLSVARVR